MLNDYLIRLLRRKLGREDGRLESLLLNKKRTDIKTLDRQLIALVLAFIKEYGEE